MLKKTRTHLSASSNNNWNSGMRYLALGTLTGLTAGAGWGGAAQRVGGILLQGIGGIKAIEGYEQARRAARLGRMEKHAAGQAKRAGLKRKANAGKKSGGTGVVKAHSRRQGTKTVQIKQRTQSAAERSARAKGR